MDSSSSVPGACSSSAHMAAVMLRLMASGGLVAVSIRPCEDNSRRPAAC